MTRWRAGISPRRGIVPRRHADEFELAFLSLGGIPPRTKERVMKNSMIGCAAALVVGMSASAWAATSDPEVIIYRFPGVRDVGNAAFNGVATVFHCTNFSGQPETIRFA